MAYKFDLDDFDNKLIKKLKGTDKARNPFLTRIREAARKPRLPKL